MSKDVGYRNDIEDLGGAIYDEVLDISEEDEVPEEESRLLGRLSISALSEQVVANPEHPGVEV